MEDCLHTSSENLSKLVSWAHSHGTICSLIPNLKHLLSEGAHVLELMHTGVDDTGSSGGPGTNRFTFAVVKELMYIPTCVFSSFRQYHRKLKEKKNQDERAAELSREQNEKTIRSTQTALRNFREFLISKYPSETREIYVIPCKELDAYLASFFVDARQKDGSEYEPNSLANYQCGLERYLKEHRYGYSITRDKEFKRSQEALKQKQMELRCKGKGNKPHKSMKLTFADELILRKRGLLSRYNPEGLLNLVWLNNTKAFGHCTGFHGSTLKWGDIRLRVTETGLEYLEWMGPDNGDVNAKSKRGGTDSRVYATQHSPQTCPVQDYKEYAQRRPPAMRYEDAPFYLSIKPVVNLAALHWYNCQALGKNKLAKMVKTMCEKGNIPGRKTNFSVYQSCSTLSEAQSNQLVLICNNLSQQAAQSMASHSNTGNFIVSASYDSSSDTA
nr:PREDICTED: zinc finger MYM-type protein 3-like [Opisthocomus hoazin]